ncbi:WD40 repeat domain-containing serine/threonine protein kinase [Nonomuraea sp. NPDC050540]|uniref:WD40 repeat domain-containing serine/threonine protein kinase n=1 Tax=Nonomuraea sp. NPDC050540 TaxID=3364367 RepID=UPI003790FF4C
MNGEPLRLGEYWLAGRLGAGGQGVVYEAYDEAANRVAVKVLHAYLSGDSALRRRFLREVRAAQRVASFCTARIIDHDLTGERPYLVTEFVAGPSLRRAAPFTGDALHRLALGVATALAAIHHAGVVHRDLKPENVLLGPDGPRVIDFGIARAAGLSMTSTGELTGTPMYMAPEVFSGGRAEPAADVFAWGALVYFAAAGRDAFTAPTTVAVINRLLNDEPDLTPVPAPLRPHVAAALAKDPELRPSAHDLLSALLGASMAEEPLMASAAREAARVRPPEQLAGEPALGLVAEQVYAALPPAERELARQVLLRLVDVREGEESPRSATLGELLDGRPAAEPVLAELERARLIERGPDTVSLGRPALLRAWPRLHEWVAGDRAALARHRRLGEAARRWSAHGRRDEDLLRGTALREAVDRPVPGHLTLNATERAFVEASRSHDRSRARRRRLVTGGVAVLTITALVAGVLAWQQTRLSQASGKQLADKRAEERARLVALQADGLRQTDPAKAMALSAAAYRIAPVPEAKAAVLSSLAQPETHTFKDPLLTNTGRALSRDGSLLVSAGDDRVRVYDVRSGAVRREFGGVGPGPFRAALSPDGDTLALGASGRIRLWSLRTGKLVAQDRSKDVLGTGANIPGSLRFSPAGGYLEVTANQGGPFIGLWSRAAGTFTRHGTGDQEVGPGDRFTVMDDTGEEEGGSAVRELPSGPARKLPRRLPGAVAGITPDGAAAAVSEEDDLALVRLADGKRVRDFPGEAQTADFSADGAYMVTLSHLSDYGVVETAPSVVTLWRVRDRARLMRFTTTAPLTQRPALSADNQRLTLLDDGGRATVYDLAQYTGGERAVPAGTTRLRMTADGSTAYGLVGSEARSWALPSFTPARPAIKAFGKLEFGLEPDLALSPDGRTLLTVVPNDQTTPIQVWDTATGRRTGVIKRPQQGVADNMGRMVFSPDGRWVAIGFIWSSDYPGTGHVALVDVPGRRIAKVFGPVSSQDLSFSADGRHLLAGDSVRVDVIDLAAMTVLPRTSGPGTVARLWMVLDRSGRRGASPYGGAGVALWDAAAWKPAGQVFQVAGTVRAAAFSPDGGTLVLAHDEQLTVFDLGTGHQLGAARTVAATRPEMDDLEAAPRLAFLPGGDLRVLGYDGTLRDLPVSAERALPQVCARMERPLSRADWRAYVGDDLPFSDPCA